MIGLVLVACTRIADVAVHEESSTVVPSGGSALPADLGFTSFSAMNIVDASELVEAGVQPGDVDNAWLEKVQLDVSDPPTGDLSFLSTVSVHLTADALPDVVIAEARSFPAGQRSVSFVVTSDVDLTPYVLSEQMSITTDVTGQRPDVDTTLLAALDFTVGVTLKGVYQPTK